MDDDNVVAYIYPALEGRYGAELSIRINEERAGYLPPKCRPESVNLLHDPDIFHRSDREMTVEEEEHDPLDYEACIKVTFDQIPKTRAGLRAGRSEDAELRLAALQGVSYYHFALTFDREYRLVVRDLGGSTRSLAGVTFSTELAPLSSRDKVGIFRAGRADSDLPDLDRVGIVSAVGTEVLTGVQTPASQPATIMVAKKLGEGSFAVVYRMWNISSGEQYALKQPKQPLKESSDAAAWESEALIMDRINHKHIVSLLNSSPPPDPWLHLEYMPGGSVQDKLAAGLAFSRYECKQIFAQTSDALAYLHMQDPQIVHRDISPNNILILYLRPDDIFIKFADFGLSREGGHLKTFCGTGLYLAPEVYEGKAIPRNERPTYNALVDIWSLGVVLTQLVCGLPKYDNKKFVGVEWCKSVRNRVKMELKVKGDDLLTSVESMLYLRPRARKSAADCHTAAVRLLQSSNNGATGGHYSDSFKSPTIRPWEAPKIDTENTEAGNGDPTIRSSSLSTTGFRQRIRSCNAPSPEITTVPVAPLLSRFDDPEDSLFFRASFGDDADKEESSSASTIVIAYDTKPQDERVRESAGSVLGIVAAPENGEDSESEFRVLPCNAVKAMAEQTGNHSVIKAEIATRNPRNITSVDSAEQRKPKRTRTITDLLPPLPSSSIEYRVAPLSVRCGFGLCLLRSPHANAPSNPPFRALRFLLFTTSSHNDALRTNKQAMTTRLSLVEILSLTPRGLVQFVEQNNTHEGGTLNIFGILGWENASPVQRNLLASKLQLAVQETIETSVDATDLAARLAQISDRGSPSLQYPSPSRSSTVEPTENAMQERETRCYQALLDEGCRPLFPISLLPEVSANADAYQDLLRPWTRYPCKSNPEDWQVFSRQLRRWKEFRKWQLDNRGETVEFSEYLDEQRRQVERMEGHAKWTYGPDFERAIRSRWEDEYGPSQQQPGDGDDAKTLLSRYAEAAKSLLIDCGFVEPFQLQADPKHQDQRTTFVEYLVFECFLLGRLRVRYEELMKAEVAKPLDADDDWASTEVERTRPREIERAARPAYSFTAATSSTATDAVKEKCTQTSQSWKPLHVLTTQKYRTAEAEAEHQQHRVDWVRTEMRKIAAEQNTAGKSRIKSRKRKPIDDAIGKAEGEPQAAKYRRTGETGKMVVGTGDNSRETRSRKRKLPTDKDTHESRLDCETDCTRAKRIRKAIHEKDDNSTPSGAPESGLGTVVALAQVGSAVTIDSQPYRRAKRIFCGTPSVGSRVERLKTLRPRVDGKVVIIRGLMTGPATKARGRLHSDNSRSKVT
ncbi:hypothetical protein V500_00558 [Pseudogymnoascus sp. VKM F-4518 (FW-2643)]|nr:hypothetical protein V500_00558 [Pseudogymnoascus sp. VKM F-4518 (FW-2643)]